MTKRFIVALSYLLFFASTQSCHKDKEIVCDHYFLSQVDEVSQYKTKLFYNAQGKLSVLVAYHENNINDRVEFIYDQDNILTEVTDFNGKVKFTYDNQGNMSSSVNFDNSNNRRDSLAYEYDLSSRLSKRSIFKALGNYDYDSYFVVNYPDEKTVQADFYSRDPSTTAVQFVNKGSFIYTIDNKQRPYPLEYYSLYASWTNVILLHNPLSLELTIDNSTTNYQYQYNAGGYPIADNTNTRYTYACQPPVE